MRNIAEHLVFKAMSEPPRLRILTLLTQRELCVCDLTAVLELPQSTISRHLARLKSVGLVLDRRQGLWVHYRLTINGLPISGSVNSILHDLRQQKPYSDDLELLTSHFKNKKPC